MKNVYKSVLALAVITFALFNNSFAQCTSASAIYVTPNGNGNGSAGSPASFTNAINIFLGDSTRTPILMAGGDYSIYNTLTLPSGISIEGSYNDNNGVWIKSPFVNTHITVNDPDFRYDTVVWYPDTFHTVGEMGMFLDHVKNIVLKDFTLSISNSYYHYAYSDKRDGYSIYAIYADHATNVQLLNLTLNTPDAENGGFGGNGAYGRYAEYTQGGGLQIDVAHTTNAYKPVYQLAPGSTYQTAGGAGGFGGDVQGYIACSGANCLGNGCQLQMPAPTGGNGGSGYRANGGYGGTPGAACDFNCYVNEYENEMSNPSTLTDIMSGTLPAPTPISQYGTPGANGSNGPHGADGISPSGLPRPVEGYQVFVPAGGGAGQPGSGGGGGGGGGAGGITTVEIPSPPPGAGLAGEPITAMKQTLATIEYFSNALGQSVCGGLVFNISTQGGPGGGGGEGGQGGGGGGGGGAVYGIYAYLCHNIAPGNITYNLGQPGTGGPGGHGGSGGSGSIGFPGPPLNGTVVFPSYRGASGGNGGDGGDGGDGQDGADGKQYQTWGLHDLLVLGFDTAHICSNSIIGIIKNPDDNVTVYQFHGNVGYSVGTVSTSPTYVQFAIGGTGSYSIHETNTRYGNSYQSVAFNVTNQRPLPAFNLRSVFCVNDTVSLVASDTIQEGYLWKVYSNGNLLTTSTAKSWKFIPPSTHGSYSISLQEYSECCGWSNPVQHSFSIEQPLTLSLAASGIIPPYCAGEDSTRLTLTGSPQAGIYPNYTYPGVTWTNGATNTDHTYISNNGNYYATYISPEGCKTQSPSYTVYNIFQLPQGTPSDLTIYPACAQMPVNVYPNLAGISRYNYYYDAADHSTIPGGSQVLGGFLFQPYFGFGYSTKDSVVIYDAPVSYEGCVGLGRGKVTIYHDSAGPYLQQPFTGYYHENADANCLAYVNYQEPQGVTYCGGYCFSTRISGPPPGSGFPKGITKVVYRIKDEFFDSLDVPIFIEVQDVTPPRLISSALGGTFNARPGQCVAAYTISAPSATDNCSGIILPTHYASGLSYGDSLWGVGTTTVYYTFTDSSHNRTTTTATVTVIDNQPPVLTCPADQVYYVKANDTAVYVGYNMPSVRDNCDTTGGGMTVTRTSGFPQFGWHSIGITNQNFQSTDANGNTGYCSFSIWVKDTIAPVLTCPGSVYALADLGVDYTTLNYSTPTAIDNLGAPVTISLLSGKASGDTASIGLYTAIWKGTDVYGNVGTCAVHITVASNQPPILTCPHDITTLNDSGFCTAKIDYYIAPAIDVDGHSYSPMLYSGLDSGAAFPFGTTTVIYSALDLENNRGWCTFNVTVKDTIAPHFTSACPHDTTLNVNPQICGAQLSPPVLTGVSYDCNAPSIGIWSGNSTHFFTMGTTVQEYRIIDDFGNYNKCIYAVTVVDNNNLTVTCPSDLTLNNDPGKCSAYIPNYGRPIVTPFYSQSCMTETLTAPFAPDLPTFPIGTTRVNYSVYANGHSGNCSWNVTIVNTEKPHIVSPPNIVQEVNPGSCGNIINFTAPVGTDTCSNGVGTYLMAGLQPGSEFPVGTTLEIYVVSDLVGNTDTAKFTVTVLDTIKPVITAHADIVDATNSMCGAVETFTAPVGTDNSACVSTSLVAGLAPGSQFPLGTTREIYVARDSAGNTDTVSFNVIVNPIRPLVSNCVDNYLQPDPTGQGQIVYYPVPGTVDQYTGQLYACPGVSIHLLSGQGSGAYFTPGPHAENYQFIVNGTGDTVDCSTNVIVTELSPPVIDCGTQFYSIAPDSGLCSASFTVPVPTTSDNGGPVTVIHTIDGVPDTSVVYTFTSGTHSINYTAYDYFGNSANCTVYVSVVDNVHINNPFPAVTYCQNQPVSITPDISGYATGLTYQWYGYDSLGNPEVLTTDSTLYFPSIQPANFGQYHIVVKDRCGVSVMGGEFVLRVTPGPVTTISGLNSGYCIYDSTDVTVSYTPAGGTLYGTGLTGNKFNPKRAGLGLHVITYAYTDTASGCIGLSSVSVLVSNPPTDSLFADSVYCINQTPIQLPATNSTYTGAGISGSIFNPATAGSGTHTLTRTVTVNGCSSHLAENVRVNAVMPNATITAPATVCQATTLYPLTVATTGGSWTGTYLLIDSLGNAKLDSHNAGPGQDTIVYTVTKSACTSSDTIVIGVKSKAYNLPYTFPQYCTTGPPVAFDTTGGKRYTGVGFNNDIFYPDSVGYRGPIFYAVITINNFGCVDTTVRMLNLNGGQLDVYSTQYLCTTHDSLFINLGVKYDSIRWADGSNSNRRWFTDTGTIQVFLRDTAGCFGYDTLHINLQPVPAQIVPTTSAYACPADSVVIFADSTFTAYKWNTGDTTRAIEVLPGNYVVTVTSNYGCKYQSPQVSVTTGPDVTAPTITCPPDTLIYSPAGYCNIAAFTLGTPIALDNCGIASVTNNAPSTYHVGVTNVTWTAKDNSNNTKTCVQRVTVNDTIKPFFTTMPVSSFVIDTELNNCSTRVPDFVSLFAASDSCSGVTITQTPAAGTFATSGITSIGITAHDVSGNTTTYYMIYQTQDTVSPIVNCPSDITTTISGATTTAVIHYTAPTQASNCTNSTVQLIAGLTSGSAFPIGVTTQKFVVTDGAGATDTCSFNVTVHHVTGINGNTGDINLLTVMPVPATDHLNIVYQNNLTTTLHVKLTSITGQVILSENVIPFSGNYNKALNFTEQAAGTYILEIISDNETLTRKIVKL